MSKQALQILPPHPLRPDYERGLAKGSVHDAFQRRLEPQNFTASYFSSLAKRLEQALLEAPSDRLRYELAFISLQNKPRVSDIQRASDLLAEISASAIRRADDVGRLRALVDSVLTRNGRSNQGADRIVRRVNWSINNRCPMVCRGCYNPFVEEQLTRKDALATVDKLLLLGTTDLVLSGGDPLLWPSIFEVIDYASSAGIDVALDTTGYTLSPETLQRLKPLASLRLPLDGSTAEVQRAFRRSRDSDLTSRFRASLKMCDDANFHRVRVHTVASQHNLEDLGNIAEIIFGHDSVRQWMIFQWWGRRASRALIREMAVDANAVFEVLEQIQTRYPQKEIFFAEIDQREFLNFMIQSNGQIVTFASEGEEEFLIGNILLDDWSQILSHPLLDLSVAGGGIPTRPR